jgi:hypothetical protein
MSRETKRVMAAVLSGISLIGGAILAAAPVQASPPGPCMNQACFGTQCGTLKDRNCDDSGGNGCAASPCK